MNISLEEGIVSFLQPVVEVFSKNSWFQGGAVILITFVISSLLTFILFRFVRRVTRQTSNIIDDRVAVMLRTPIYYTLVVIGLSAGLALMPLPEKWEIILLRCIRTIGVLVWMVFFVRLSSVVLKRLAELSDKYSFIQYRTVTLFDNLAKIVIFAVATYAIFVIWNINMTAWMASAGVAGIAISFAAKDTLSNLFSGVFILVDAPYKVGDYVVLDNGDRGKVTNIGLRSTRILTRDDIEITVPNSVIGNATIINQSGGPHEKLRIRLKIGVAYGSDIDLVREVLLQIAKGEQLVCKFPTPRVRFRAFGDSSLDFELLFWVNYPEERGRALDIMNTRVYKEFMAQNIEIPYPKRDIYIKELPAGIATTEVNSNLSG